MAVIYKEIGFVNGKNFDWHAIPALNTIKCWANFFKHPKAYMYLHHPTYHLESDPDKPTWFIKGEINSKFVSKYYTANADNAELKKIMENGSGFKIFFPDLLLFTQELCEAFTHIVSAIKEQPNIEKLRKYTIQDLGL